MPAITFTSPSAFIGYASKLGVDAGTLTRPVMFKDMAISCQQANGNMVTLSFTPPVSSAFCQNFINNPNA